MQDWKWDKISLFYYL